MNKLRLISLLLLVLVLNLIWEFSHYSLYYDFSGMEKIPRLIIASFGDVLLVSLIFAAVSLKRRNIKWLEKPNAWDYFIILVLGLVIAAIVEVNALATGQWVYRKEMPQIFGIGLSPLIQLFATAIASLTIMRIKLKKY